MTDSEYMGWVEGHCRATAAGADAAEALLSEPVRRYFTERNATAGELGECTYRLVAGAGVPKYGNLHSDAIAAELIAIRRERSAAAYQSHLPLRAGEPACRWCKDSGLVTVPHPLCVEAPANGAPRLVEYRHEGIHYRAVVEVSVLCDRRECAPGRRQRDSEGKSQKPRPTLTKYLAGFAGAFDPVAMLEQHNRELAAACRQRGGADNGAFTALFARLKARVAEIQGEAA